MNVTRPTGKLTGPGFTKPDKPKRGVSKDSLPPLPRAKLYEERTP